MALAKSAVICLMMMMVIHCGVSMAANHMVGDSAGWTIGHTNYQKWADSKNFHDGDTLVFKYNSQNHNVMRMSHQDYSSCNTSFPIAVYTSGSDRITLQGPGHYYFICGFPGHCEFGQKVNVRVTRSSSDLHPL
ncbi:hypothetical protein ACOSQ3_001528 [Xanthoceras sorbifolium]